MKDRSKLIDSLKKRKEQLRRNYRNGGNQVMINRDGETTTIMSEIYNIEHTIKRLTDREAAV